MYRASESIAGSWYPTGFHGHFRNKSRNDFEIPYRFHAKPIPPQQFINRAQVRSDKHLFSRHDNRNVHASSMGDLEMHFSMGLGKRKPASTNVQFYKNTKTLLHWSNNNNSNDKTEHTSNSHFQSSYKNSYIHSLDAKTKMDKSTVNDPQPVQNQFEPIHSRRNRELRRRLLTARPAPAKRSPPLLAWGSTNTTENDNLKSFKPYVGDSTRRL